MARFSIEGDTLTIELKVAETVSKSGHPQWSMAEEYTGFAGRFPIVIATNAETGEPHPMFGSFSIGREVYVSKNGPVVTRHAAPAPAPASQEVTDAAGNRYLVVNGTVMPVVGNTTTTVTAPARRGRPLGSKNKVAVK